MTNHRNTVIAKVEDYVTAHPRCQSAEIVRELDLCKNTVNMTLQRLRSSGLVRRIQVKPAKGPQVTYWEAGLEPGLILIDAIEGAPKRRTVTTWEPHLFRDPLVAIFFSKQPIQQEQA